MPLTVSRPVLRYHGGKYMLAPWIIKHFPKHRIYTEAYGGAANVLMRKPRSYAEIYNELDAEIVNVFKVLRDDDLARQLHHKLRNTPFARTEFLDAYDTIVSGDGVCVEQARRTIIKAFMGFGSDAIKNKSGFRATSNKSGTTPAHDWANYFDALPAFTERLAGVVIESRPAIQVLNYHDSCETLHYVDPPYVHETRESDKRYRFEMSNEDHTALALTLHRLKGFVVLSGYDCQLYRELYGDWFKVEKPANADGARPRIECLWLNRNTTNALHSPLGL